MWIAIFETMPLAARLPSHPVRVTGLTRAGDARRIADRISDAGRGDGRSVGSSTVIANDLAILRLAGSA